MERMVRMYKVMDPSGGPFKILHDSLSVWAFRLPQPLKPTGRPRFVRTETTSSTLETRLVSSNQVSLNVWPVRIIVLSRKHQCGIECSPKKRNSAKNNFEIIWKLNFFWNSGMIGSTTEDVRTENIKYLEDCTDDDRSFKAHVMICDHKLRKIVIESTLKRLRVTVIAIMIVVTQCWWQFFRDWWHKLYLD